MFYSDQEHANIYPNTTKDIGHRMRRGKKCWPVTASGMSRAHNNETLQNSAMSSNMNYTWKRAESDLRPSTLSFHEILFLQECLYPKDHIPTKRSQIFQSQTGQSHAQNHLKSQPQPKLDWIDLSKPLRNNSEPLQYICL